MNYYDIYYKRLNRFGTNFQDRVQNKRAKEFENYRFHSVYKTEFEFEGEIVPGTFEPYKQNNTQTLHYLLTPLDVNIPAGTVLMLSNKNKIEKAWMVYYLEEIKASGYNKYLMLRMTNFVTWTARDGSEQSSWVYLYGQEDNMLKDEIRSRSRMDALYGENLKTNFFVMPKNPFIKKDIYIEIGEDEFKEAYVVTGYDINSSPGVEFVTVDPTYIYDNTPAPYQRHEEKDEDFSWLTGEFENGDT